MPSPSSKNIDMKRKQILLLLSFIVIAPFLHAQVKDSSTYRIDASQWPRSSAGHRELSPYVLSDAGQDAALLLNGRLYAPAAIPKLFQFLLKEKNKGTATIIKDESGLRRYTSDPSIKQILSVRLSRCQARRFRRQHDVLAIRG